MSLGPAGLNYYYNVLCPLADKAMQFAFFCLLDRHLAEDKVVDTYRQFSNSLPSQGDSDTDLVTVMRNLWSEMEQLNPNRGTEFTQLGADGINLQDFEHTTLEKDLLIKSISTLPLICRATYVGVDGLGFDEEQIAFILSLPIEDVCKSLAISRKAMLSVS